VNSSFRSEVAENYSLLGHYAESSGNFLTLNLLAPTTVGARINP